MYNDIHEFTHVIGSQTFTSGVARHHIVVYTIIESGKNFYGVKFKIVTGDEFTLLAKEGQDFLEWYRDSY